MLENRARIAALVPALIVSPAFARAGFMVPAVDQAPKPTEGRAMVVFMRPSMYGGANASTVYEASDTATTFLGGVDPHPKLAYPVDPGFHRFMVVTENADFVDANLEAGTTYYVRVSPRPGLWKARFPPIPIVPREDAGYSTLKPDFTGRQAKTTFVEPTLAAQSR